ncbi:leucine-rich repeat domain-containing protein [Streptomyces sp. NPDC006510]|uniref:leucine-rich repeat domain-containing protein n=1 Tax=Streptomyces sp. NPDC006510 TaxID=3155600 RepID=UPI0033BD780A
MDPSVAQAISQETGQQQPFSLELLQSVTYLHVSYARTLEDLSACQNLEILQIIGCDPVDLRQLGELPTLATIVAQFSNLENLAGVEHFPSLRRLTAGMNRIEDLSPLLSCPKLRRLDVRGNPLSENSYRILAPQLQEKGVRVSVSGELDWKMTLELQRRGLPYCFYKAHDGTRLCRPGLALTDMPDLSHPIVAREELANLLDQNPDEVPKLFDRMDLMPTTLGP